jgi:hypothetical protein
VVNQSQKIDFKKKMFGNRGCSIKHLFKIFSD